MKLLMLAAVFAVLCVASPTAEAGRGLVIINTGDDVMEIGDIKPEMKSEVEAATAPGVKVGVKYDRFGIFWIDIVRWNSSYVLFQGDTFWEVGEKEIAEVSVKPLSKPITVTIPPGLMGLGAIAIIWIVVAVMRRKKPEEAAAPGAPPVG